VSTYVHSAGPAKRNEYCVKWGKFTKCPEFGPDWTILGHFDEGKHGNDNEMEGTSGIKR